MTAKCHGFTIGDKVMRAGMLHCELIWEIPVTMLSRPITSTQPPIEILNHNGGKDYVERK